MASIALAFTPSWRTFWQRFWPLRWPETDPMIALDETRLPDAIRLCDAYVCGQCAHVTSRAPFGRCQRCGSKSVQSLTQVLHAQAKRLETTTQALQKSRAANRALQQQNIALAVRLARRGGQEGRP